MDTGAINQTENRVSALVQQIPPGQRVFATILTFADGDGVTTMHIIDRACIGRCFDYANYEPSTGQFRVRANCGNQFVMTDPESAWHAQIGKYIVQQSDLPLVEIYQSDSDMTQLGIHQFAVGERTASLMATKNSKFVRLYSWNALLFDFFLPPILIAVAYVIRQRIPFTLPPRRHK
jgi:hypothetical protein